MEKDESIMTVAEVCDLLARPRDEVLQLIEDGELAATPSRGRYYIRLEDLEEFVWKRSRKQTS